MVASHVRPLLGTWPTTQACAMTGNQTGDPLVFRLALDPLIHTDQGMSYHLKITDTSEDFYEPVILEMQ